MHFTYNESPEENILNQGDVLKRTPELEQILKGYYSYFGSNEKNQFFLVITQACDLVPRADGLCKAKYIELAAVRPLRVALDRELSTCAEAAFQLPFLVAGQKRRPRFEQFVERLYNNNEQGYFFLRKEPTAGLPEDSCAFLQLTVPIKAEHYSSCVSARILSLSSLFQAKLGWLIGQLYARVGTDDWDPKDLRRIVAETCEGAGLWIDEKMIKEAATQAREWSVNNPTLELDRQQLTRLVSQIPSRKALGLKRLSSLLLESNLIGRLMSAGAVTAEDVEKLLKQINSDQRFSEFFK